MKKRSWIFLLSIGLIFSCAKEEYDYANIGLESWQPSFAVPLVNSQLGVDRILTSAENQDVIRIDPDGFVTLVYDNEVLEFELDNLFNIPDVQESVSFGNFAPSSTPVPARIDFNPSGSFNETLDFGGAELSEILLKAGGLRITLANNSMAVVDNINLQFTSFERDGTSAELNVSSSNTVDEVNLSQYTFKLLDGMGNPNTLRASIQVNMHYPAGSTINPQDEISLGIDLLGLRFSRIFGDFKQTQINLPKDSFKVNLFTSATTEGDFEIGSPIVKFIISNSLGTAIQLSFDELASVNLTSGRVTPLNLGTINNTHNISAAEINASTGAVKNGLGAILIATEGLRDIIQPTPQFIRTGFTATINPGPGPYFNFLVDTSKLRVNTGLELPLEGILRKLDIIDTVDFSFGETFDELESLNILLLTENGFPLDADLQLYVLENDLIIDSLIKGDNVLLEGGLVAANGRVDQVAGRSKARTVLTIDKATANNMLKANKLKISASLRTTDSERNQVVRIYNDYLMLLKLGVIANGNIQF